MNLNNGDNKAGNLPPIMGAPFKKTSPFSGGSGISKLAGGLKDKFQNLSRKDLAFVGIGLSVLLMAPVAEYLMSKPSEDNLLTPGFSGRESSSGGGSPYEPGINALSEGSPDGSGEVITPLSARDPLSLVMGAQPASPAYESVAPRVDVRDAIKDAGRASFKAATSRAPTPIPKAQGSLRALGSFFSGGESTQVRGGLSPAPVLASAKSELQL